MPPSCQNGIAALVESPSSLLSICWTTLQAWLVCASPGPSRSELLSKLSELDASPAAFPNLHCAQTRCAEIHGTLIRVDLGSLPSYDLYFSREFGEYMWEAIFHAGEECGVAADRIRDRGAAQPGS